MAQTELKPSSSIKSWSTRFSNNTIHPQTSTNNNRRNQGGRASLGIITGGDSEDESNKKPGADCVTWQTVSQKLTLKLQERRRSEMIVRPYESTSIGVESNKHVSLVVEDTTDAKTAERNVEDIVTGDVDVHMIPLEKLVERFASSLSEGLTDEIVIQHRLKFGSNKLTPPRPPSLLWMFIKELVVGFNGILWIATLFAFLSYKPFGEPEPDVSFLGLGVLLSLVIIASAIFNFYQELKSMKIVASFSKMQPTMATVKRNGRETQLPAEELVPGDIIRLRLGEKIPADCRLISCDDLQVNTSQLTGESVPICCTVKCTNENFMESANLVFYSSLIVQGAGEAIVFNIGDATVLGQVGQLTRGSGGPEITGLHREINRFIIFVVAAAIISIILLWVVWASWLNITHHEHITLNENIVNSIGMIVTYIPEGLPAAVTLVLTIVAKRMYKQKVMVKSLATVETFNCVSVIATDKTGTLTMNEMTITSLHWGVNEEFMVPIHTDDNDHAKLDNDQRLFDRKRPSLKATNISTVMKDLILGACLCNNAVKQTSSSIGNADSGLERDMQLSVQEHQVVGDAADVAMYRLCQDKCSVDVEKIRKMNPRINAVPFNSKNKFMIVANLLEKGSDDENDDEMVLITLKGAPDFVIDRCSTFKDDGADNAIPISDELRSSIRQRQEELGKSGYRVIAMLQQRLTKHQYDQLIESYKTSKSDQEISSITYEPDLNGLPKDQYCFLGMFALLDPARPEVPDAVMKARRAHIRVAMVTGDHPTTAAAIAKKVNILSKEISIDGGLDRFQVEHRHESNEICLHLLRNEHTLVKTHIIKQKSATNDGTEVKSASIQKTKPNLLKRIWSRFLFYLKDPNQVKIENKLQLIPYAVVVTGTDMHSMDDEMWDWVLSHQEIVFARTSPEQKLRIVMEFSKRGEVVAVTGDGTNDAPALKQAHLGVAMAAGTDVAKEAGDMVLLDNNFAAIIDAIETGRLLSDNLKKVAIYLLPGGSWSEVMPVFFASWLGIPLSLSLFLAVIFCMFNDVVNSLAMVSETAEQDIMSRPPALRHKSHLIDWKLLVHAYLIMGNIECFTAFFCFFWYYSSQGIPLSSIFFTYRNYGISPPIAKTSAELLAIQHTGQSIYYVALCVMQMFNLLSTRTRYVSFFRHNPFFGKARNLTIIFGILFSTAVCLIVTLVPWFNSFFKTQPVPIVYICPALGFGFALFLFDEIRKLLVRCYPNSILAKMAW